jgi:hypothetical protein
MLPPLGLPHLAPQQDPVQQQQQQLLVLLVVVEVRWRA